MITINPLVSITLYVLALAEYALIESITNSVLLSVYNRLSAEFPRLPWGVILYIWAGLTWVQPCYVSWTLSCSLADGVRN
jgi:hypothetical protein